MSVILAWMTVTLMLTVLIFLAHTHVPAEMGMRETAKPAQV